MLGVAAAAWARHVEQVPHGDLLNTSRYEWCRRARFGSKMLCPPGPDPAWWTMTSCVSHPPAIAAVFTTCGTSWNIDILARAWALEAAWPWANSMHLTST